MMHAFTKPQPPIDWDWEAYEVYLDHCNGETSMSFAQWLAQRAQDASRVDEMLAADAWDER